ncbi:MAG TPA: DUF4491 domain-containing protein [Lachnospiraceae bacterium]|nr:DUF4491 domain-containing protein [Lachnospiraceae bacterium]
MNLNGVFVGFTVFCFIGLFHVIVVKAEYFFTKRIWPLFLIAGILLLLWSLWIQNTVASSISSVLGITCLWSIKELFEQERRVECGWFPQNPKRSTMQKYQKKHIDETMG